MITGMISPCQGSVYLGQKNITNLPMFQRARLGIGYLSQEPSIFTKLTVEENIKLVLEMTFIPPDRRSYDRDNLVARMKAGIDGLADALRHLRARRSQGRLPDGRLRGCLRRAK